MSFDSEEMFVVDDTEVEFFEEILNGIDGRFIAVDDLQEELKSFITQHSRSKQPLSDSSYNAYLDNIENNVKPYLERLDELSENVYDEMIHYRNEIKKCNTLINNYIATLNKNKLDYGLKGQIKKRVEEQGDLPTISEQYELEPGYSRTNTGGKNTRKKHKKLNTKRQKF